jgi:hypothetical protein
MNENVLAAILWRDEAIAFGCIKPFHGAVGHLPCLLHVSSLPRPYGACCAGRASRKDCMGFVKIKKNTCELDAFQGY